MTDFGARLRHARKNKKMTQKELANRLGVEQTAISNYETNFRVPATSTLVSISELLDVSLEYLLSGDNPSIISNLPGASLEAPDFHQIQIKFLEALLNNKYFEAAARVKESMTVNTEILELYEHVFEPTLKAVGDLWELGKLSIAEEHIISDLIDRLLMSLSESKYATQHQPKPFSVAFMLPGAEMHQFPLKITAELFKDEGWSIFYIGKSIPFFSLKNFFQNSKIHVLVLSITLKEHLNSCESLIKMIKELPSEHRPLILVGGHAIDNEKHALHFLGADRYYSSLQSLKEGIKTLENR